MAAILCLGMLMVSLPAFARDPKPIDTVPFEELPAVIDGQHHYLLICVDQWNKSMGNTDGIVLVTLDTRAHRVMLTSLIRDALVKRPDGVTGRVNYVAANFGMDAFCKMLSEHLGVRIEKYILFNFGQIQDIIDYLGGVDIEVTNAEIAYLKRYAIPVNSTTPRLYRAGTYHFRGHSAVIYMRIRKVGGGGDFMRTQRVRTVLSTLADNCREISIEDARALANEVFQKSTKTNMTIDELLQAADYAYTLRGCTMEELRLPPDGAVQGITYAGMAAQEVDWIAVRAAMANYLENSFLVLDEDEDDEFGDFVEFVQ